MADNFYNNQSTSSDSSTTSQIATQSNSYSTSPWDEDLDLPPEKPKDPVVGMLGPSSNASGTSQSVPGQGQFSVPDEKIANNAVPTMVEASNFNQISAAPIQGGQAQVLTSQPNPQGSVQTVGISPQGNNNSSNLNKENTQAPNDPGMVASLPQDQLLSESNAASLQASDIPAVGTGNMTEIQPSSTNKLNIFPRAIFNRDKKNSDAGDKPKKQFSKGVLVLSFAVLMLVVLSGIVFLTEQGLISIGFENAYGSIGLEKLWGGLGTKTETALGQSFLYASKEKNISVKGDITLTIDKDIDSKVTAPLVLSAIDNKKIYANSYQKAFLTIADSSLNDDSSSQEDSGYLSDLVDDSSNSSSVSSDNAESDVSDDSLNSAQFDQESQSYESFVGSTVDLNAKFDGNLSNEGSEMNFAIERIYGDSSLAVKYSDKKIWVKSADITYDQRATSSDWVEFDLSSNTLSSQPVSDLFNMDNMQGVTISGKRLGSEVVSGVRAYKYSIESMQIGNALESLGIKSSMIQSITGDAWIGIKDKKPKKIILNIATAGQQSVSNIKIDLQLTGFSAESNFAMPDSSSIILSSTANQEDNSLNGTTAEGDTDTQDQDISGNVLEGPSTEISNDESRKNNLKAIKDALDKYKTATGKYPVAKDMIHLEASGNVVESALVPKYISILPSDPSDSLGWFYGYKSTDGKSFTLSCRLEDNDGSTQLIDGMYLYFLSN